MHGWFFYYGILLVILFILWIFCGGKEYQYVGPIDELNSAKLGRGEQTSPSFYKEDRDSRPGFGENYDPHDGIDRNGIRPRITPYEIGDPSRKIPFDKDSLHHSYYDGRNEDHRVYRSGVVFSPRLSFLDGTGRLEKRPISSSTHNLGRNIDDTRAPPSLRPDEDNNGRMIPYLPLVPFTTLGGSSPSRPSREGNRWSDISSPRPHIDLDQGGYKNGVQNHNRENVERGVSRNSDRSCYDNNVYFGEERTTYLKHSAENREKISYNPGRDFENVDSTTRGGSIAESTEKKPLFQTIPQVKPEVNIEVIDRIPRDLVRISLIDDEDNPHNIEVWSEHIGTNAEGTSIVSNHPSSNTLNLSHEIDVPIVPDRQALSRDNTEKDTESESRKFRVPFPVSYLGESVNESASNVSGNGRNDGDGNSTQEKRQLQKPNLVLNVISKQDVHSHMIGDDDLLPPLSPVNYINVTKRSHGERICCQVMEEITGKPFGTVRPNFLKNPETGRNLEIDCYNHELRIGVEYNGEQHYKWPNFTRHTYEQFIQQARRDQYKIGTCDDCGIYLITVPYTVNHDEIKQYIVDHLPPSIKNEWLQKNKMTK